MSSVKFQEWRTRSVGIEIVNGLNGAFYGGEDFPFPTSATRICHISLICNLMFLKIIIIYWSSLTSSPSLSLSPPQFPFPQTQTQTQTNSKWSRDRENCWNNSIFSSSLATAAAGEQVAGTNQEKEKQANDLEKARLDKRSYLPREWTMSMTWRRGV